MSRTRTFFLSLVAAAFSTAYGVAAHAHALASVSLADGDDGVIHTNAQLADGDDGVIHTNIGLADGDDGVIHTNLHLTDGDDGVIHTN